jgi:hypothetical protein
MCGSEQVDTRQFNLSNRKSEVISEFICELYMLMSVTLSRVLSRSGNDLFLFANRHSYAYLGQL